MTQNSISRQVARQLLEIEAVRLSPANPFTWASGWKSPIYCDNRRTLSFPGVRDYLRDSFCQIIKENYPETGLIAGVATGAIAHGVLVAEKLGLAFCYVRSSPKNHGLANLIEGYLIPGKKVLIIEDLISTGGSSLKALEAIRQAGSDVLGMLAIFSYGFPQAKQSFESAHCALTTLSDYENLIREGVDMGLIGEKDLLSLREWREKPSAWKGENL